MNIAFKPMFVREKVCMLTFRRQGGVPEMEITVPGATWEEFCQDETFTAHCDGSRDVVLMESVSWSLTSLFSTNTAISETWF